MEERPQMPFAQTIYGEVVYWLVVVSALVCTVGPLLAMWNLDNNVLNPHYLFNAIWEGKNAAAVWGVKGGTFPGGHFWLTNFTKGDGFTQIGLVIGCAVAAPALVCAALAYLFGKKRQVLWAVLSLWVAVMIIVSVIGIVSAH